MARYLRKEYEVTKGIEVPREERMQAQQGDILVGDPHNDRCTCEYEALDSGRPVMLKKAICCQDCVAKDIVAKAAQAKHKRIMEINSRLNQIDQEAGPRTLREEMIASGRKGFNNKIETLENEAKVLRVELAGL